MFKHWVEKLSKEQLVELCNELLTEEWDRGNMSSHYIRTMLDEISEEKE